MRKLSMDELNRKSLGEFSETTKFPVVAVLENIRSAYNVGSVFRTADAFMLREIVLVGYTAYPPHKQIMKTALGAEESVSWKHFKSSREAVEYLRMEGYFIFGVEQTDESVMLQDLGKYMDRPVAFIFGNEVSGVEQETLESCDRLLEIPQFGTKHSLNISVAAGTVLWEAVKNVPAFAQLQKG